jgi:ABC-type uncharacterized transport system substrate-binding protein
MPAVGLLNSGSPNGYAPMVAAFRQGLRETGYVEGQNVAVEYRRAEGQYDRVPAFAAELARRQVAVIVANTPGARAVKAATTTIPIVSGSVALIPNASPPLACRSRAPELTVVLSAVALVPHVGKFRILIIAQGLHAT